MIQKSLPLLLFLSVITLISNAQPVTFSWAQTVGGRNSLPGKLGIARDQSGDYYVTGQFTGTRSFGATTMTASGSSDVYVVKVSSTGSVLWAVKGGSTFSQAQAGNVAVSGGSLYIIGSFSNYISFGANCTTSAAGMGSNVFVANLDATNGNCNWIFRGDGNGSLSGSAITPATGGGVYICGTMIGQVMLGTTTLTGSVFSDTDIYYAKLTASGICTWAKQFGGFGNESAGGIIEINANAIALNGGFEDVVSYTGGSITSTGATDFFLAKTTSTGDITWARAGGGDNTDLGTSIGVDTAGNIYSSGIIGDTVTFGGVYLPNPQNINALIVKYNASGVCQWAKMGGTITDDNAEAIATDPNGSSYITGYVSGNAVFGTSSLNGVQGYDAYVAKYNTFGQLVWITKIGAPGGEFGKAITYDGSGVCVVAGEYEGTLSLPGVSPISSPGTGVYGTYLAKLGGGSIGLSEVDGNTVTVYPNPVANELFVNIEKITDDAFTIELLDIKGSSVYSQLQHKGNLCKLDVQSFPSGRYLVRILTSKGEYSIPVMILRP